MKLVFGFILLQIFVKVNGLDVNPTICSDIWVGLLPHPDPQKCTFYVRCFIFFPTVLECPPNTIFIPHSNASIHDGSCVPGYIETCELLSATTTSKTSTRIDTTTEFDDSTQTTENEIESTTIPELTTDLESNQPTTTSRLQTTTPIPVHRCPPGGFGYIPHHTNCNRYFECIKGIRHMRFCPDGLLFDSVTLQCTYPELAVCAGKH